MIIYHCNKGINGGELVLHYQPMVDTGSRVLVGAEALLRWQHPVRGLLPPAEFLSIAEDTHLIVSLGEWVIDEVCRQWRSRFHAVTRSERVGDV